MRHRHKITLYQFLLGIGIGATIGVEILAEGPWAHAVWVPVGIMLSLQFLIDGKPPCPPPADPITGGEGGSGPTKDLPRAA